MKHFQNILFSAASALISVAVLFYFIHNSDVGLDVSDSSFYLLNIYNSFDISIQLTMFGVLWESVFGNRLIVDYRIINISIFFFVGYLITYRCTLFFKNSNFLERNYVSLLGGTCYLFYFSWFLLDPSYNSLNVIFFSLSWLAFVWMIKNTRDITNNTTLFAASVCFGIAMSGLILTKITTTLSSGTLMAVIYLFLCWRQINLQTMKTIFSGGILGIIILLSWLWVNGYSPYWLFESFKNGLDYFHVLLPDRHPPLYHEFRQLEIYIEYAINIFVDYGLSTLLWLALMVVGLVFANRLVASSNKLKAYILVSILLSTIWFAFNWPLFTSPKLSINLAALNIILLCNLMFGFFALWFNRNRIHKVPLLTFPVLLIAPLLTSTGTGIGWQYSFLLSMGIMFVVTLACIFCYQDKMRILAHIPVFALILAGVSSSWARTEYQAYRLGSKLSDSTIKFEMGNRMELLRAPPQLAEFYKKLAPYRYNKDENENFKQNAPLLFDLSGRSPGATLQLGLTPPKTAWNLSGYSGSNDALNYVMDLLNQKEIENAWIIDWDYSSEVNAPNLSRDIINQRLSKSDQQFPRDYELLTEFYVPYAKSQAKLYRPK